MVQSRAHDFAAFSSSDENASPAPIRQNGLVYVWETNAPKESVIQLGNIVLRGGLGECAKGAKNESPVFPQHLEYPDAIIGPAYGRKNQGFMQGIYILVP